MLTLGFRVGHWTDHDARTGCTVILCPEGTTASAEVRGGAPATRELALLEPHRTVQTIHAVLLTGGSAFGLAAADGVMRFLEEQGRGVPTPAGNVPIVPSLALFDLAVGAADVRPTAASGYAACRDAETNTVLHGRVGAGTGARVGQWRGPEHARDGGLVTAAIRDGDLEAVALIAVNAAGDVDHHRRPLEEHARHSTAIQGTPMTNTTIGLVATNARLDKTGCLLVAQGAHDGLARAIVPPHTRWDGDAFVAAATGRVEADVDAVRLLAAAAVEKAILSL
ncbi:peptidase [Actinorhabdospora filicis]|uniref:Peptidase n=1 Tax=Actinorhabdospora filicis TaxID=1785913 RepID=A0A9W6SS43_9ACTN|nr:P1 family peptidase [Actinorhabdospora filicis]GLZ80822.1 peptidase [Actinorhabdospora filicis]